MVLPKISKLIILIVTIISVGIGLFFVNRSNSGFDINEFVEENYGYCDEPKFCNSLVRVNCDAHRDGPQYYLNKDNGEIVDCGGDLWCPNGDQIEACKRVCPPRGWDCD
jgi:hypothetical protein